MQLIMQELQRRGVPNRHTLAYQSRVGPVEWLKPYTDDSIRCAQAGLGQGLVTFMCILAYNLKARHDPPGLGQLLSLYHTKSRNMCSKWAQ